MNPTAFVINKLSHSRALRLAVEVASRDGIRQKVYKHPVYGWTWGEVMSA